MVGQGRRFNPFRRSRCGCEGTHSFLLCVGTLQVRSPVLGADDGIRTRDPHLGKVVLYQLSHVRVASSLPTSPPWSGARLARDPDQMVSGWVVFRQVGSSVWPKQDRTKTVYEPAAAGLGAVTVNLDVAGVKTPEEA